MARVRDLWHDTHGARTPRYGKGKRWQAVWTAAGKERTKTFTRKTDADRYAARMVNDVERGAYIDPKAGRVTVAVLAERWLLAWQEHVRPNTAARYRGYLHRHVYPTFGDMPVAAVRPSAVQAWVASLTRQGLAPATVQVAYWTLAAVCAAAVKDGLIASTPCTGVKMPRARREQAHVLTVPQVLAVAAALPGRWAVLPRLGAASGLRPGELLGLEVDPARGVDFLRRQIKVGQQMVTPDRGVPYLGPPKTEASQRTVPVDSATLDAVAEHLAQWPAADVELEDWTGPRPRRRVARLLFTTGRGRPVSRQQLGAAWRAAAGAAGLPVGVGPHALRHTYVSLLIAAREHPKVIQERVGHASITETMGTYGHLMEAADDTTRAAMLAAFAPPPLSADRLSP